MKKILLTIITLIVIAQQPIVLAVQSSTIPNYSQETQTNIILDSTYKPANSPGITFANEDAIKSGKAPEASSQFGNFLLQIIAGGLITVAAPVAIIIIAIAGLMAVVSHGNQGLMDKAKKALTWAVIGLVIIIFSWIITKAIITAVISSNGGAPGTTTSPEANKSTGGGGGGKSDTAVPKGP